jgi:hypothetical protein
VLDKDLSILRRASGAEMVGAMYVLFPLCMMPDSRGVVNCHRRAFRDVLVNCTCIDA